MKHPTIAARLYTHPDFTHHLTATFGTPWDATHMKLHLSDPVQWDWEVRCWITHNEVVATSLYQDRDRGLWNETWTVHDSRETDAAQWLTTQLRAGIAVPPGVVIDVGYIHQRGLAVVEANQAWASSWYSANLAGVRDTLDAAIDWEGHYPQWRWIPDPVLTHRTTLMPPLHHTPPTLSTLQSNPSHD